MDLFKCMDEEIKESKKNHYFYSILYCTTIAISFLTILTTGMLYQYEKVSSLTFGLIYFASFGFIGFTIVFLLFGVKKKNFRHSETKDTVSYLTDFIHFINNENGNTEEANNIQRNITVKDTKVIVDYSHDKMKGISASFVFEINQKQIIESTNSFEIHPNSQWIVDKVCFQLERKTESFLLSQKITVHKLDLVDEHGIISIINENQHLIDKLHDNLELLDSDDVYFLTDKATRLLSTLKTHFLSLSEAAKEKEKDSALEIIDNITSKLLKIESKIDCYHSKEIEKLKK